MSDDMNVVFIAEFRDYNEDSEIIGVYRSLDVGIDDVITRYNKIGISFCVEYKTEKRAELSTSYPASIYFNLHEIFHPTTDNESEGANYEDS